MFSTRDIPSGLSGKEFACNAGATINNG